jgi:hypothetical protein
VREKARGMPGVKIADQASPIWPRKPDSGYFAREDFEFDPGQKDNDLGARFRRPNFAKAYRIWH